MRPRSTCWSWNNKNLADWYWAAVNLSLPQRTGDLWLLGGALPEAVLAGVGRGLPVYASKNSCNAVYGRGSVGPAADGRGADTTPARTAGSEGRMIWRLWWRMDGWRMVGWRMVGCNRLVNGWKGGRLGCNPPDINRVHLTIIVPFGRLGGCLWSITIYCKLKISDILFNSIQVINYNLY